jgi:hypothetical protein
MAKQDDLLELQQMFASLSTIPSNKLVEATRKQLRKAKADDNGILVTQGKQCLDVRVTRPSMDRSLNLLNTLFAVLEQRGFSIELQEAEKPTRFLTCLKLAGEEVQVHLEEKLDRTEHVLTHAEKKKLSRKEALSSRSGSSGGFGSYGGYGNYSSYSRSADDSGIYWWEPPKWDYHPSGQLRFEIDNLQSSGQRHNWSDSSCRQLESLLLEIAYHIIQAAEYLKKQALELEGRKRRWAEEERQRADRELQRLEEQRKADHLEKLLGQWSKQGEIMQFLSWLDGNMPAEDRTEDFIHWYEWAKSYAQKLNPLAKKDFYNPEQSWHRY